MSRLSCVLAALAGSACGFSALAQNTPASYKLHGVVRDFSPSQKDFAPGAANSLGLSAGNVSATLNARGLPAYTGAGMAVTTPARDTAGHPIAPSIVQAKPVTTFSVSNGRISSPGPVAAKVTVIGSAITYGGQYDVPVTMRVHAGGSELRPFGSYDGALSGNVHTGAQHAYVLPSMVSANSAISIDARSWVRKNATSASTRDSDWSEYMSVASAGGGSQVRALRNGDSVPSVGGYLGQTSAKTFLQPYIDSATGKIRLAANQVIYLFELGTTSTSSAAFDMQDLVVLVDLASDPSYFAAANSAPSSCVTVNDTPAVMGSGNAGGIGSAASFSQWFETRPGYNVAKPLAIDMVRDQNGVYAYSAGDFHPIDGQMYGNGGEAHNRGFTYAVEATFDYCGCSGQFFQYTGDGEAWLYINGKLVLDVGGAHKGASQYVDMDRLGLTNGAKTTFQLFYAERSTTNAAFEVKTNIVLKPARMYQNYTSGPDAD